MTKSFNIYQNGTLKKSSVNLTLKLDDLKPATYYSFQVSQVEEEAESPKSNKVVLLTNGIVILPTKSQIVSIKGSIDPIGIEADGLDAGASFGGTIPTAIKVLRTTMTENSTTLEVPAEWNMGDIPAILLENKKYLAMNKNKSVEIITE